MKVSNLGQTKAAVERQRQQQQQQQQQRQQQDGADSDEDMLDGSDGDSDSGVSSWYGCCWWQQHLGGTAGTAQGPERCLALP
jgi:hypothetical protein